MNTKRIFISLAGFLFSIGLFGQKSEIAGFYLEKIDDIGQWDSIVAGQLKLPSYHHVSLTHLSVDSFEHVAANNQIQIVDVRTEIEYNEGHVPDAIWIDIKSDDFMEKAERLLDRDKSVAVYCKGGVRSRRAAEKLLYRGFHVYNLNAGFDQWKKEGKEVEK